MRPERVKSGDYVAIIPEDPSLHPSLRCGRVREHVAIAEIAIGHPLPSGAVVHHVNGIKTDNRNENLVICQDSAFHFLLHQRQRAIDAGFDPDTHSKCYVCGYQPRDRFLQGPNYQKDGIADICRACRAKKMNVGPRPTPTHCYRGHAYEITPTGARLCRKCIAIRSKKYNDKNKALGRVIPSRTTKARRAWSEHRAEMKRLERENRPRRRR